MKKLLVTSMLLCMLSLTLTGCTKKEVAKGEDEILNFGDIQTSKEEKELSMSYLEQHDILNAAGNKMKLKEYQTLNEMILELNAGRIDGYFAPISVARYVKSKNADLKIVPANFNDTFLMATRKEDQKLCDELSNAITTLMDNGATNYLKNLYIYNSDIMPKIKPIKKEGKNIVVGVTGDYAPIDFISEDGIPTGYNVALMNMISEITGYNFTFEQVDMNARFAALKSGKIDVIFVYNAQKIGNEKSENDKVALTVPYHSEREAIITTEKNYEVVKAYMLKQYEAFAKTFTKSK